MKLVPVIMGPLVPPLAAGATIGAHVALIVAAAIVLLAAVIVAVDVVRWVVAPRPSPVQVRLLEVT